MSNLGYLRFCLLGMAALAGGAWAIACTTEDADPVVEDDDDDADGTGGSAQGGAGNEGGGTQTGSGGASSGDVCSAPAVAAGTQPLIADFEGIELTVDGYMLAFPDASAVYIGTYAYADDSVGTGNHVWELVPGPDSDSALSTTIPGSTEWGGGFGFWIDGCPDVSVYQGVTFALRSNVSSGSMQVDFQTADTRAAPDGLCTAANPDAGCVYANTTISVSTDWQTYELAWSDFTPGTSDGTSVPVDGTNWVGLEFHMDGVYNTPEDLEMAIDDFSLY